MGGGGYEYSADWWKEIIENTCKHFGKTIKEFNDAVEAEMLAEYQEAEAARKAVPDLKDIDPAAVPWDDLL